MRRLMGMGGLWRGRVLTYSIGKEWLRYQIQMDVVSGWALSMVACISFALVDCTTPRIYDRLLDTAEDTYITLQFCATLAIVSK
jgi:hypothetical protein